MTGLYVKLGLHDNWQAAPQPFLFFFALQKFAAFGRGPRQWQVLCHSYAMNQPARSGYKAKTGL